MRRFTGGRKALRRRRFLTAGAVGFLAASSALASQTVMVSWDAGPEPDLAGYHLLIGTTSHVYTESIDVKTGTTASVTLDEGQIYYFGVSAYNTLGSESLLSNEVSYPVPLAVPPPFGAWRPPGPSETTSRQIFKVTLEASGDNQTWTPLAIVPISVGQTVQFFRTKMTLAAPPSNEAFDVTLEASGDLRIWIPLISVPINSAPPMQFLRTLLVPVKS